MDELTKMPNIGKEIAVSYTTLTLPTIHTV